MRSKKSWVMYCASLVLEIQLFERKKYHRVLSYESTINKYFWQSLCMYLQHSLSVKTDGRNFRTVKVLVADDLCFATMNLTHVK